MVRSIIEYASIVWSPYTQRSIQITESIQRRSARFILLGWNTRGHRCKELRLLMLYKIMHHLVDINADDLLPPRPQYQSTRGHSERFSQLQTRVNAYLIFPNSIRLWNSLPEDCLISTHSSNLTL